MVCTRSVLDSIGRIRLRIFRNFSVRFDSNIFRLGNFCTSPFPSDLDAGRLGSPGSHWPSLLRRTRTLCNCSSSRVDSLGTYLSRSLKKKKKIHVSIICKKKRKKENKQYTVRYIFFFCCLLTCHTRLAKSCARRGSGSTVASRARGASRVNGILTGSTLLAPRLSRARVTFERTWRTIFTRLSPMLIFERTLRTKTTREFSCV